MRDPLPPKGLHAGLLRSIADFQRLAIQKPIAATIGNFDGVHRGHQLLLTTLRSAAPECCRVALSFYPPPAVIIRNSERIPALISMRHRLQIMAACGIDYCIMLRFTKEFAALSAEAFVDRVLRRGLNVRHLVVGPDTAVGKGRAGDIPWLREALPKMGCAVSEVNFLDLDGEKISSRTVRALLRAGDIERVEPLLGFPYSVDGRVVRGDGRGRQIGFPTANIGGVRQLLPANGVYGGYLRLGGEWHRAAINIGLRPTFAGRKETVECHLIDGQREEFYGAQVVVAPRLRLRDEIRFESVTQLTAQITTDVASIAARLPLWGAASPP